MDILSGFVDLVEQILVHEGMVALGVVLGKAYILVHIERDDVLEGNLSGLDHPDEFGIGLDRG